jgi:hypothetical protein
MPIVNQQLWGSCSKSIGLLLAYPILKCMYIYILFIYLFKEIYTERERDWDCGRNFCWHKRTPAHDVAFQSWAQSSQQPHSSKSSRQTQTVSNFPHTHSNSSTFAEICPCTTNLFSALPAALQLCVQLASSAEAAQPYARREPQYIPAQRLSNA